MQSSTEKKIYYPLRIASALCFIGHGSFGIITKAVWCNYFAVFGIAHNTAITLMPYLGTIDICLGVLILFYPLRIIVAWLVVWGFITALLRPLSGEPFAEFIERTGNYGAPLALLLLTYVKNNNQWKKPIGVQNIQFNEATVKRVKICLRVVVFLLIFGHGWLNLIEKKSLLDEYTALGFSNAINAAHIIGGLEILAAVSVLIKPIASVLLLLFIWKVTSELFYPHWEFFEFIERSGSYGSILALWFLTSASVRYSFITKDQKTTSAFL
ncbi:MAG: hypothetical protein ABJB05_08960 [Parafilimonas sp.]